MPYQTFECDQCEDIRTFGHNQEDTLPPDNLTPQLLCPCDMRYHRHKYIGTSSRQQPISRKIHLYLDSGLGQLNYSMGKRRKELEPAAV